MGKSDDSVVIIVVDNKVGSGCADNVAVRFFFEHGVLVPPHLSPS